MSIGNYKDHPGFIAFRGSNNVASKANSESEKKQEEKKDKEEGTVDNKVKE